MLRLLPMLPRSTLGALTAQVVWRVVGAGSFRGPTWRLREHGDPETELEGSRAGLGLPAVDWAEAPPSDFE